MALVSPMAKSRVNLIPPVGCKALSQPVLPEVEDGTKHILWSPESAAVNVNRPADDPFWDTTR